LKQKLQKKAIYDGGELEGSCWTMMDSRELYNESRMLTMDCFLAGSRGEANACAKSISF